MPFDPRMLQMAQAGVRMMGPDQRNAFADPRSRQQYPQEMQPLPYVSPSDPSKPDDPNAPKKPPSLLDMMMGLGRMTPQQYNQRIHGAPPDQQQGQAQVSPWAWLGGLGGGARP